MSSFGRRSRPSDRRHVCDVTVTPCHLESNFEETNVTPTSSLTHIRNVERLAFNTEKTDSGENEKEGQPCRRIHHAEIIKVVSEQSNGHVLVLHTTCVTWIRIEQGMHARRVWRD